MDKKELEKVRTFHQVAFSWWKNQSLLNSSPKKRKELLEEYSLVLQEEDNLLQFLEEHYERMDALEVTLFLNDFFSLEEKTFAYYKSCFQNQNGTRHFQLLTEQDDFRIRLQSLLLTILDVISYLNYPNEFWKYIQPRISLRDSHIEEHQFFYLVNIKCDQENRVIDMHVGVPVVVNLKTALINIHEFRHAYDLYQLLGTPLLKEEEEYEKDAKEEEKKFIKECFFSKNKSLE